MFDGSGKPLIDQDLINVLNKLTDKSYSSIENFFPVVLKKLFIFVVIIMQKKPLDRYLEMKV